jgi:hypothetical protein
MHVDAARSRESGQIVVEETTDLPDGTQLTLVIVDVDDEFDQASK